MRERSGILATMPAKTASFDPSDDWGKAVAIIGALIAFGKLPKKYGVPVASVALLIALQG